jgi:hypothetical protein
MFTVAECRAQAEQKLAQAEHDDRVGSGLWPPLTLGFCSLGN